MSNETRFSISSLRHPDYIFDSLNWERYRDTYEGGDYYRDKYLQKFSTDETALAFNTRKNISPIPAFAKQALLEVRNSIFQRLADVTRIGGSEGYQAAMKSNVDREGTGMNQFIGVKVLTELLVIGRVGIYVDAPNVLPTTLAEKPSSPYLYHYAAEDILSWQVETEENLGQFKSVLLRDRAVHYETHLAGVQLPDGERKTRYRLVWRDPNGDIRVRMYNDKEEVIYLPDSEVDGSVRLDLPFVPFVMPNIGGSLLKDVWSYQVSLLNIMSGAVNFDLSSNVPFLTIQTDLRTAGSHLKSPTNNPEANNQTSKNQAESIGSTQGRYYDKTLDRPQFIAPPSEPLLASLKLQDRLQDDIRRLVALAVEGKSGSRTESGEAKKMSSQSLEAGLSFIGTVLQTTEQQIAEIWASYENTQNPNVAQIGYPTRYSLKTDEERLDEAERILKLADKTPSKMAKRAAYKQVITLLFEDKVTTAVLTRMHSEVDAAKYTRTDMEFIVEARKEGLVSDETASDALGFAPGEVEKAADDHAERLERILASQSKAQGAPDESSPASRGVPDLDVDTDTTKDQENREKPKNPENS